MGHAGGYTTDRKHDHVLARASPVPIPQNCPELHFATQLMNAIFVINQFTDVKTVKNRKFEPKVILIGDTGISTAVILFSVFI